MGEEELEQFLRKQKVPHKVLEALREQVGDAKKASKEN